VKLKTSRLLLATALLMPSVTLQALRKEDRKSLDGRKPLDVKVGVENYPKLPLT
jgi:hypothetical protein